MGDWSRNNTHCSSGLMMFFRGSTQNNPQSGNQVPANIPADIAAQSGDQIINNNVVNDSNDVKLGDVIA